ncbi:Fibrinogen C domain-containing protein 1 [Exaiptasia diaphana]|nr:Fibrinogen C domain-containing protein 1 [Exaiptasia diaphana]
MSFLLGDELLVDDFEVDGYLLPNGRPNQNGAEEMIMNPIPDFPREPATISTNVRRRSQRVELQEPAELYVSMKEDELVDDFDMNGNPRSNGSQTSNQSGAEEMYMNTIPDLPSDPAANAANISTNAHGNSQTVELQVPELYASMKDDVLQYDYASVNGGPGSNQNIPKGMQQIPGAFEYDYASVNGEPRSNQNKSAEGMQQRSIPEAFEYDYAAMDGDLRFVNNRTKGMCQHSIPEDELADDFDMDGNPRSNVSQTSNQSGAEEMYMNTIPDLPSDPPANAANISTNAHGNSQTVELQEPELYASMKDDVLQYDYAVSGGPGSNQNIPKGMQQVPGAFEYDYASVNGEPRSNQNKSAEGMQQRSIPDAFEYDYAAMDGDLCFVNNRTKGMCQHSNPVGQQSPTLSSSPLSVTPAPPTRSTLCRTSTVLPGIPTIKPISSPNQQSPTLSSPHSVTPVPPTRSTLYGTSTVLPGIPTIKPTSSPNHTSNKTKVYCDRKTAGGGWTVFQRRKDGSVDFYREWNDYTHAGGMGGLVVNLLASHRCGPGSIPGHGPYASSGLALTRFTDWTSQTKKLLRVDLEDFEGKSAYAEYDYFALASTAGNSLSYHLNERFTTKDQDNDGAGYRNCAKERKGAWWYDDCSYSNLNGRYSHVAGYAGTDGVNWYTWKGSSACLEDHVANLANVGYCE